MPLIIRSIACSENDRSSLSTGPMIAPGLTAASCVRAPRSSTSDHAARSAIVFERV
jgi:hypothetical protein